MPADAGDVSRILKRDQRTIKNALVTMDTIRDELCGGCRKENSNNFSISRFPVMFFRISNLGIYTITDIDFRTFSSVHKTYATRMNLDNFMPRLVKAFIFGVCLLSVVRIPTAMSAPASTHCQDREYTDGNVPKWINPCGQEYVLDNSSGGSSSGENDTDIIGQILMAANIALEYMENFRENYVNQTFQTTYAMQVNITREHKFLPKHDARVPKQIGEKVDQSHLESRIFDEFLRKMYRYVQMYAVGIEQVVLDQQIYSGKFRREFNDTESHLRKVLCELRMGMSNKNIKPENNVGRCVLEDTQRYIDATGQRNLRDWIIFRECMNGLEYLIQVLEYFEKPSS